MKYFLDSNIIIYFIKGTFRKIGEKLEEHEKDIVIPSGNSVFAKAAPKTKNK